ncbi:MAG TPA: hypothetical protein VEO19_15810 [Terriglobia bacterium]|nr:hypothetical protein [Terriglobia bacterium]
MIRCISSFLLALVLPALGAATPAETGFRYQSAFMRVEVAPDQPALVALAVDSLGKNKLNVNPLRPPAKAERVYELRRAGNVFEYRPSGAPSGAPPAWIFEFSPRRIHLRSHFAEGSPPPALTLNFNSRVNHATLLGLMNADGSVRLPALLHLPDLGTFRIVCASRAGLALGYDALRFRGSHDELLGDNDYVKVTFPPASSTTPQVDYTLDVVEIHPDFRGLAHDSRFDGFRRNWLNIFQLNPRLRVLANHASSDPCAFTLFEYSSMAVRTPPLASGLSTLELLRQTLDRYLGGMKAYGMAGAQHDVPYDFLDSYPSLLIATSDYVHGSNDQAWLQKNYTGIKDWTTRMLAMDREGKGLIEYPLSGNSGSWPPGVPIRPANWWDDIGFGHQDAYSNALAYRALIGMAELARQANQTKDAQLYSSQAQKLRSVYFQTFYNPETGLIAGWKSADGKLHDYYFTFVNGAAITYGLVPRDTANQIMDRLLAKMKAVGYSYFQYGLPGVLIPVRPEDYVWGTRDPFQVYQNGGASGSFAYFTLEALYQLGRPADGDAILFPMLEAYENGGFQGFGPNGKSYDWKSWDGAPHGYEGLLVDNYQALLAVLAR